MKVTVILADVGTKDAAGKLNLLGVGWTQTILQANGRTPDLAVAVVVEIQPEDAPRDLVVVADLIGPDGEPVIFLAEDGRPEPVRVENKSAVARAPADAPEGSPAQMSLLMNVQGGLPLQSTGSYTWRISVDGEQREDWQVRFFVRDAPSGPADLGVGD